MTNISFSQRIRSTYRQTGRILILCLLFSGLWSCRTGLMASQGISGIVVWFEGDLLPGIGKEPVEGIPAERKIYVYRPTLAAQAEVREYVFYNAITTELIKKVSTDQMGNFKIKLEPGTYSVFTEEPNGLFANRFDEEGYLNPVQVAKGEWTDIVIRIDYRAAY